MADNVRISAGSNDGAIIAADDIGSVIYPRNKLIFGADGSNAGDVAVTNPFPIHPYAVTTGGISIRHIVTAASTNAASVKASAGQVYSVSAFNAGSSAFYVKFHNTAGTPSAGTGIILALAFQAGLPTQYVFEFGLPFATGIGITIVGDITDAGTTATALSQGVVLVTYK